VPRPAPSVVHYKLLLEQTLANADAILAAAISDQSSISQALKMANADSFLGAGDDEKLDELRWHVCAKDCAALLAKGITEAPSTSELMGALKPRVFNYPSLVAEVVGADSRMDQHDVDDLAPTAAGRLELVDTISKKANRDSSAWGQGLAIQPATSVKIAGLGDHVIHDGNQKRHRHIRPPAKLMRLVTNAVMQWDMIQSGDRLLLGLSGGKDSLALLHCLMELQRKLPTKFEIEVCTIDPQTPSFDPSPLIPYVESLGLKYHYVKDDIVARASTSGTGGAMVKSLCAFCARMKRGNLYACARRNQCNKLVLAQHLDDCAESFMMSVMHNGFLRTMKANYKINSGDISVIRPMVYCRESLMAEFSKSANLPVINENCPACFEEPKERARVKKLLSREETLYPNFYDNIKRSLLPLMHEDATAILRCYTEETLARSRKESKRDRSPSDRGLQPSNKKTRAEEGGQGLNSFSDEALVLELARRKAEKFHLAGAMKGNHPTADDDYLAGSDLTGQVCTLNGENGTIPCRELME
jgi:tRNA(Ile)-lysidine synthase TilS/MesJ